MKQNFLKHLCMLLSIAFVAVFSSCQSGKPNIVEIVKTDTLHVYHTDTIHSVHSDTVYSVKVQTIHDSIIKQTIITQVVNEHGEVIHSEKETNNETFHNADTDFRLVQHTVDSLLKVKMDSIYHASDDKEKVVEKEKSQWLQKPIGEVEKFFAVLGLIALLVIIIWTVVKWRKG